MSRIVADVAGATRSGAVAGGLQIGAPSPIPGSGLAGNEICTRCF